MLSRRVLFRLAGLALSACCGAATMTLEQMVQGFFRALHARPIATTEPTTGDWHNQNTWGDQFVQQFPLSDGSIVQVLPKLDHMYGPPAVHSVQLARGDGAPPQNAEFRARVSYGNGGVNNSFDCDWLHGAQFALVCNSINVSGVTYAPDSTQAYHADAGSLFLGVTVGKGTTQSSPNPLTLTEQVVSYALNAIRFFPVRDFARAVTLHVPNNNDPSVPTGFKLNFFSAGVSLAFYDAQVCAGGRSIPIPGGTTQVFVQNSGAPDPTKAVLQWFLGL